MTTRQEILLPAQSPSDTRWQVFLMVFIVFWVIFALRNLLCKEAMIPSALWLAFIGFAIWNAAHSTGLRKLPLSILAAWMGREFAEVSAGEIHFGFMLFGKRYVTRTINLAKVQIVEWKKGQGKEWNLALWFAKEGEHEARAWRPGQTVHIVGPALRQDLTENFGLSFVDFLRVAGVPLVRGIEPGCFVRDKVALPT